MLHIAPSHLPDLGGKHGMEANLIVSILSCFRTDTLYAMTVFTISVFSLVEYKAPKHLFALIGLP